MPPSSPIELDLFDFVDNFALSIKAGNPNRERAVTAGDAVIGFCTSFFAQFFANVLACPITGFDPASKRKASRLAEAGGDTLAVSPGQRLLVTSFESFCDMYQDVVDGSYGAAEITYTTFHDRYLSRLLEHALAWARELPYEALADRIALAQLVYSDAATVMKW